MAVISRRAALALPALGLARRRRRVAMRPDDTGLGFFQIVTVAGSGVFVYSGTPAAGNLVASITAAAGTDPYGNAFLAGITDYSGGGFGQLNGGALQIGRSAGEAVAGVINESAAGVTRIVSGQLAASNSVVLFLKGGSPPQLEITGLLGGTVPQVLIDPGGNGAVTGAGLEVQAGGAAAVLELIPTAAGNQAVASRISTDTSDRHTVDGNGAHSWGPGNAVTDCGLSRAAANKMNFSTCDVDIGTVGRGLQIKEGANARQGTAVLVGGTVVVANTSVTSNTRIYLGQRTPGGTPGALFVSSVTNGTGFTITSTNNLDTSTVAWLLIESG